MNQSDTCYVILHMSHGPSEAEARRGARVVVDTGEPPFHLTENIWMERFDKELGEKIEAACNPQHYNIKTAGHDRHFCLGLRFSEVLALQWHDIDWEGSTVYVRRAIVQGRLGDVKTEYSEAPVPLDPMLAELLQAWRHKTAFANPEDWVFASPFAGGRVPYFPTAVRRKIHAAAERAGLADLLRTHRRRSLGTVTAPGSGPRTHQWR